MEVGILTIEEECVRFPDFVQHSDTGPKYSNVAGRCEFQPLVPPVLAEVTIHAEHLPRKNAVQCSTILTMQYNHYNAVQSLQYSTIMFTGKQ